MSQKNEMRAWVLKGKRHMVLENRPMPEACEGEAVVKIKAVGICGSDVHYYKNGKVGAYEVKSPLVLGHECAGEVVSVGKNVTNVKTGDRVVLEPGISCGVCGYCTSGKYNLCQDMKFMATPPFDGCLCEYMAWPARLLFKMPEAMTFQEGALVEPFVVALQALRQSEIGFSQSAVVVGTGTIGLLTMQALKAVGAGQIIAVGRSPQKLQIAAEMGATHLVNSVETDAAAEIKAITGGLGAMYGFEAVGTDDTYYKMADYLRDGGTVTFLGLLQEDGTPMPMITSVLKELKYHAVIRYTNLFAEALTMLRYKRAEITRILTHRFDFEDADKAFEEVINNRTDLIKAVINL